MMTRPTVLDGCVVLRQQPAVTRVSAAAVGMTHGLWLCGRPMHFLTCARLYVPALCRFVHARRWWVCCTVHALCSHHTCRVCAVGHAVPGADCWCDLQTVTQPTLRARSIGFAAAAGALPFEAAVSFLRAAEPSGLVLTACACMLWAGIVFIPRGTSNSHGSLHWGCRQQELAFHLSCVSAPALP